MLLFSFSICSYLDLTARHCDFWMFGSASRQCCDQSISLFLIAFIVSIENNEVLTVKFIAIKPFEVKTSSFCVESAFRFKSLTICNFNIKAFIICNVRKLADF